MKKILFTGFEPFDGAATNPSWDAVSLLPEEIDGCRISRILLPVEYDSVGSLLDAAIAKEQPDAVICVGQAGGRSAITPEMVAINLKDASIPDNAGISYDGVPILEGAPAAYFATIPVKSIAATIREAGIPASVSYTAGTYVCNSLMYHLDASAGAENTLPSSEDSSTSPLTAPRSLPPEKPAILPFPFPPALKA